MAKAVMLDLGTPIGRQHAHDAAQDAFVHGELFGGLLAADRRVTAHSTQAQIQGLLDPTAYTGLCADMAREAVVRARAAAKELLE